MVKFRKSRNIFICIILIFAIITSISIVKATASASLKSREEVAGKMAELKSIFVESKKIEMPEIVNIAEVTQGGIKTLDITTDDASDNTTDDTMPVQSDDTYSVQIELNIKNQDGEDVTEGNKLKITDITDDSNEGGRKSELEINLFNINSGDQIEISENDTFSTEGQGVIVDLSNLEKNKKYQILIEDIEAAKGYNKSLENLVLEVLIDEEENIIAKISEITNTSGEKIDGLGQLLAILDKIDEDGILKIKSDEPDPTVEFQYKIVKDGEEENIEEDEGWENYSNDGVKISENSTIYAKAIKNGIESGVSIKIINNIDTKAPEISDVNEENGDNDREVKITAKITDNASGLVKYGVSRSETEEPDTYISADDNLTEDDILKHRNEHPKLETNIEIDEIYENGDYYIWIWDSAGNCAIETIEVTQVNEVPVAEIVETDSQEHQELAGQTYTSLYKALEASPENSSTTIRIIAEVYNENNEVNNRDITLNLNGYTVNNKSTINPTLTVNEGSSLTIINTDENGVNKVVGSLESKNTEAILVKNEATLTVRKR